MGPAPSSSQEGQRVEVLDPSRRRLLRVVSQRPASSPPTVGDLVEVVGGHPNTTRHHLRVLVGAGLLREEPGPPGGGRGRPATRYAVTPAGREVVREVVRDSASTAAAAEEYVALAAAFAERLAERDGDPGTDARAIGKAWGTGLVARHAAAGGEDATGQAAVVDLLDGLGFSPDVEPAPVAGAGGAAPGAGATVLLRTCPLLDAAQRHPEVVCQVHLGLVAGALEAHGEVSDGLRLVPFARPGACELGLPPTLGR